MKTINVLLSDNLVEAFGWMILHSIWQGALFVVLLGILLVLMNRCSSSTRYFISWVCLLLFIISTIFTFSIYFISSSPSPVEVKAKVRENVDSVNSPTMELTDNDFDIERNSESEIMNSDLEDKPWYLVDGALFSKMPNLISFLKKYIPYLVIFWFLGILIFFIRFLGGLVLIQHLKNYQTQPAPLYFQNKMNEYLKILKIKKGVNLISSKSASTPLTLGVLKPMIIIPIKLFTTLSKEQIEGILVHELAHIKRNDYLVNIIQNFIGILFFYHPGVWWMSATIQNEREKCCDDLSVNILGEHLVYAKTLITLKEEQYNLSSAVLGMIGIQYKFNDRIRRLLDRPAVSPNFKEGFVSAVIFIVGLSILISSALFTFSGQSPVQFKESLSIVNDLNKQIPLNNKGVQTNATENQTELSAKEETLLLHDVNDLLLLLEAIRNKDTVLIGELIEKGVHINQISEDGITPLSLAIDLRYLNIVRLLIKAGGDVNAEYRGKTPLLYAVSEGRFNLAKLLIEGGADVNQANSNGLTPLEKAIRDNRNEMAKLLIESGADKDHVHYEYTPLLKATREGNIDLATILLEYGAKINQPNQEGQTPLLEAVNNGKTKLVSLYLEYGASVDVEEGDRRSVLFDALDRNSSKMVQLLIGNGVDVNQVFKGQTPLIEMVKEGNLKLVKLLVSNGADVNEANAEGKTPLFEAVVNGRKEIVSYLVAQGAAVDFKEASGKPLLVNAIEDKRREIAKILIENGAEINNPFEDATPLMRVSYMGNIDLVKLLVKQGANINYVTSDGKSPLFKAVEKGHKEIVSYLLSQGATVDYNTANGINLFLKAIEKNRIEIVKILIENGAKVNIDSGRKSTMMFGFIEGQATIIATSLWTPLLQAISSKSFESIEVLLDNGANVNHLTVKKFQEVKLTKDMYVDHIPTEEEILEEEVHTNWTPLMEAVSKQSTKIIDILLKYGANTQDKTGEGKSLLDIAKDTENESLIQHVLDVSRK